VLGLKVHVGKLDKKRKYKYVLRACRGSLREPVAALMPSFGFVCRIVRDRRVLLSDLAVVSLKIIKEDVETVSKGDCSALLHFMCMSGCTSPRPSLSLLTPCLMMSCLQAKSVVYC